VKLTSWSQGLPLAGAVAVRPLADRVGLSAALTGRGFVPVHVVAGCEWM
jgi:hypothetical protein